MGDGGVLKETIFSLDQSKSSIEESDKEFVSLDLFEDKNDNREEDNCSWGNNRENYQKEKKMVDFAPCVYPIRFKPDQILEQSMGC